jgi:Domain of unknown function (DUF4145)
MAADNIEDLRGLAGPFPETKWPFIPCPVCRRGSVHPAKTDSIVYQESQESLSHHEHPDWEPYWINGHFSGVLTCERSACREFVHVVGEFKLVDRPHDPFEPYGPDQWNANDFERSMKIKYFEPHLLLIDPDGKSPDQVCKLVNSASIALWSDPSSAANRVRSAVEELLTRQHVRKTFKDKGGRTRRYTAHQRIQLLKDKGQLKYQSTADFLMAVKWIGNDGSHGDELSVSDVLDGVELMNEALDLLYETRTLDLQRKAALINKAKGLPKTRTARRS